MKDNLYSTYYNNSDVGYCDPEWNEINTSSEVVKEEEIIEDEQKA